MLWTVVLKKILESPLDCKGIQPVHPKREESWVFIGGIDVEAETPILWPPDGKNWLLGKDSDAGKDWKQEEQGITEDEMVGLHHQLSGHEFEQAPGVGDGQGNLACCSPWGCKESDMTEWLNWTEGRWLLLQMQRQKCKTSINMKNQRSIISPNNQNNLPVTDTKAWKSIIYPMNSLK